MADSRGILATKLSYRELDSGFPAFLNVNCPAGGADLRAGMQRRAILLGTERPKYTPHLQRLHHHGDIGQHKDKSRFID
jgi:hypothetical protein